MQQQKPCSSWSSTTAANRSPRAPRNCRNHHRAEGDMNAIPIRFKCPSCNASQEAASHLAGRALRCYQCQGDFTVPTASDASGQATPDPTDTRPSFECSSVVELG